MKTFVREAKREQRLGRDAVCVWCGVRDLEALREVPKESSLAAVIRKSIMEEHHVLGRANDPDLKIILCLSCHAIASESQRREVVPLKPQKNALDHIIASHKANACFLRDYAIAEDRKVEELEALAGFLDSEYLDWRTRWSNRK